MSTLYGILPFCKWLITNTVDKDDTVIDATIGNGKDTLFLAETVGSNGHVYGFDIQKNAIENTASILQEHSFESRVTLIHDSHEFASNHLSESLLQSVRCILFNLGYLPGGDKKITTTPTSTLNAIKQLLPYLKIGGLLIIVVYPGHEEGKHEKDILEDFTKHLPQEHYHVLHYKFVNQKNSPPLLYAIEKRK